MYHPPTEMPEPEPHWMVRMYRYFAHIVAITRNYGECVAC